MNFFQKCCAIKNNQLIVELNQSLLVRVFEKIINLIEMLKKLLFQDVFQMLKLQYIF